MKKTILFIAAVLVSPASFAAEPTFTTVQNDFRQQALSLLSEKDLSNKDFTSQIAKFADETFGAHPDLMRQETEKRFKGLPQLPAGKLVGYAEHKSADLHPFPAPEIGWLWLLYGCDPEKLANWTKKLFLSRQLVAEQVGRHTLINRMIPDNVYRNDKSEFPDLVVDSLGDLFVIKIEFTEAGVCKPVSIKWMKKKS